MSKVTWRVVDSKEELGDMDAVRFRLDFMAVLVNLSHRYTTYSPEKGRGLTTYFETNASRLPGLGDVTSQCKDDILNQQ
jgi:hypothetical protein